MVGSSAILHIIEILGVFVCAHHFWPKGVTYGEDEDWAQSHRKRNEHGSKFKQRGRNGSSSHGNSSRDGVRRERSVREARRGDSEYRDRQRRSRIESSRY